MALDKAAKGINTQIERAQQAQLDRGIPASALRDQLLPRNLGPRGNTGGGYSPDPDAVTRVAVRLDSGGAVYERRRLNLIAGAGVTITFADDSGNEEIDITFASSTSVAYVVALDGTIVLDAAGDPVTAE